MRQELARLQEAVNTQHVHPRLGGQTPAQGVGVRSRGESLSKALGGTRTEIASGVSIGIQDSVEMLFEKIERELGVPRQFVLAIWGRETAFGYDAQGRLASVANALNQARSSQYDAKGNLTRTINARGQQIDYAYDAQDRLITKTTPEGAVSYQYDAAGNLTKVTSYNGSIVELSYDALNRVTQSKQTFPGGYTATIGYGYDANGNRTSGGFGVTTNNRLTTDGTYNYTYDDAGNIKQRTKISDNSYTVYEWDHRNRLVSVTDKTSGGTQTQKITYSYDAFNRLVQRTSQTTSGGAVTTGYFVHDGNQIVLELESDGDVAHRLLWGPAVDQALADETFAGTTYWYLTDHLGTVRDVATYSAGTIGEGAGSVISSCGLSGRSSSSPGSSTD